MSKLQTILVVFLMAIVPSVCLAEDPPIPVQIPLPPVNNGNIPHPHAPARPLASGNYDFETHELVLYFTQYVGDCVITITSTAGDFDSSVFDTSLGTFITTLSGACGSYTIIVSSYNGWETGTEFLI